MDLLFQEITEAIYVTKYGDLTIVKDMNLYNQDKRECKDLFFETIAIQGDCGYATDYYTNGIFKVDLATEECVFVDIIPDEPLQLTRLYCAAIWHENRVFFVPAAASAIAILSIEDNSLETIKIPVNSSKRFPFYNPRFKFIRAVMREHDIWLIPASYPGVIRFNIKNYKMDIFDEWVPEDRYCFRLAMCVEETKFLISDGVSNAVLVFDMEREHGEILHIGTRNNGVMSMCHMDGRYWFAPRRPGAIIAWNPMGDEVEEIDDFPAEFNMADHVFAYVYAWNNKLFFVPSKSNKALCYSNGGLEIDNSTEWKKSDKSIVEHLFETGTDIYFREAVSKGVNQCFKVSKISNVRVPCRFYISNEKEWSDRLMYENRIGGKYLVENPRFGLAEFVKHER